MMCHEEATGHRPAGTTQASTQEVEAELPFEAQGTAGLDKQRLLIG